MNFRETPFPSGNMYVTHVDVFLHARFVKLLLWEEILPIISVFCIPAGNRGLTLEIWNNTVKSHSNLDDVLILNETASDYILSHTDKTYFTEDMDNYVSRARGYFIPPYTGSYSFMIMADDGGSLYLSNTENPSDKVLWKFISIIFFQKYKIKVCFWKKIALNLL